jgi:hypothetical protein
VASAVLNTAIFLAAVAMGIFPSASFVPDPQAGMALGPVVLVSVVGALGGTGVFTLLRRRFAEPMRVFLMLAGAVLVLSFAAPFVIPGMTPAQIWVLEIMHVVVAATTVGLLWQWNVGAEK